MHKNDVFYSKKDYYIHYVHKKVKAKSFMNYISIRLTIKHFWVNGCANTKLCTEKVFLIAFMEIIIISISDRRF